MEDISRSVENLNLRDRKPKFSPENQDLIENNLEDETNSKTLYRMILASSIAASYHIVFGISMAYSAILNPQLMENVNKTQNTTDEFTITKEQSAWVASVIVLAVPVGAPFGGILMDYFGRLNTVKLATIPAAIGWAMIALSQNLPTLLAGRMLTGFASAWGTGPAIVYITEIARKDIRGSLISFAPAYTSLGMVLAYIKGWAFSWRVVAWMCTVYALIPLFIVFLIPESPDWLVSKDRTNQAQKSLNWIYKHQYDKAAKQNLVAQRKLVQITKNQQNRLEQEMRKKNTGGVAKVVREFLKPTGYKPLFILIGLFVCQQFSGIYITLFYSIEFFEEVESGINPYLSSILIGAVRAIMSVVNTYMLKTFKRRTLILSSSFSMALCMFISGLFTHWTKEGTTTLNWVPVVAVMLYVVASMIGLLSIPWTMTAELFPIEIRGVAHSLVYAMANLIMFFSVQSYHLLKDTFGGVAGVQWFFAVISLAGLIYSYIFLPETHQLELSEVQEYFKYNSVYIGKLKKAPTEKPYVISRQF